MFGRFTSQEHTNVHRTAFFLHTPTFSLSKVTALKVAWGKDTSKRAKSLEVTFPRVSRRGRHFINVGDVIIYPDLVVARTDNNNNNNKNNNNNNNIIISTYRGITMLSRSYSLKSADL